MNRIINKNEFGFHNYEIIIDTIYKIILKECGVSKYIIEFKEVNFFSKDTIYFTEIILIEKLHEAIEIGFERIIQFLISSQKFKFNLDYWNELKSDAISDAKFYKR